MMITPLLQVTAPEIANAGNWVLNGGVVAFNGLVLWLIYREIGNISQAMIRLENKVTIVGDRSIENKTRINALEKANDSSR